MNVLDIYMCKLEYILYVYCSYTLRKDNTYTYSYLVPTYGFRVYYKRSPHCIYNEHTYMYDETVDEKKKNF